MTTDKHEAWMTDVISRGLRTVYPKGFHGILRDRRLTDADKIRFLDAWPSADDWERGEVARARQGLTSPPEKSCS